MTYTEKLLKALRRVQAEKEWMNSCGGNLAGYVQRYGARGTDNCYGDGGEAIYAADLAALQGAEKTMCDLIDQNQGIR